MPHLNDLSRPVTDSGAPTSDAERLAAALEALAVRDQVLAERTRRLTSLEHAAARLAVTSARLDAAQGELSVLRRARDAELAERDLRIADLERRLVIMSTRGPKASVEKGPDDLKQIKGVGPAIEALLHSIGITTFEQVAAFSDEDVSRVADLLERFPQRIHRDRWIEQAAALAGKRFHPGDLAGARFPPA